MTDKLIDIKQNRRPEHPQLNGESLFLRRDIAAHITQVLTEREAPRIDRPGHPNHGRRTTSHARQMDYELSVQVDPDQHDSKTYLLTVQSNQKLFDLLGKALRFTEKKQSHARDRLDGRVDLSTYRQLVSSTATSPAQKPTQPTPKPPPSEPTPPNTLAHTEKSTEQTLDHLAQLREQVCGDDRTYDTLTALRDELQQFARTHPLDTDIPHNSPLSVLWTELKKDLTPVRLRTLILQNNISFDTIRQTASTVSS